MKSRWLYQIQNPGLLSSQGACFKIKANFPSSHQQLQNITVTTFLLTRWLVLHVPMMLGYFFTCSCENFNRTNKLFLVHVFICLNNVPLWWGLQHLWTNSFSPKTPLHTAKCLKPCDYLLYATSEPTGCRHSCWMQLPIDPLKPCLRCRWPLWRVQNDSSAKGSSLWLGLPCTSLTASKHCPCGRAHWMVTHGIKAPGTS